MITDELIFNIDSSDGVERIEYITNALNLAYGYGFDEGRHSVQRRNQRKVVQMNLIGQPIKLWGSIGNACYNTGIDRSSIGKCARGELATAGGFKWQYVNK